MQDIDRKQISASFAQDTLSFEEEQYCTRTWRNEKDQKSLDRLIIAHQRMAVATAMKFKNYGLPIEDLIQEGVIGLLEAAKRFDPDKGFRFSTYAGWWIKASIQDYLLRNWSIVRIGTTNAHKRIFFNLGRIRKLIEQAERGDVEKTDVAHKFKVTVDDLDVTTSRLSAKDASLNVMLQDDGITEKQDLIPDERDTPDVTTMRMIDDQKLKHQISTALHKLKPRQRDVIKFRYLSDQKMTLAAIGDKMNLSKERIRQLENEALRSLRQGLNHRLDAGAFL